MAIKGNVMVGSRVYSVVLAGAMLMTMPAIAQTGSPEKSTTDKAKGAATQPLNDVNLKKNEIPAKLKKIQNKPYSLRGMKTCSAIQQDVRELNVVLGPDVNERVKKSKAKKREATAANVAGSAIGSIIPFRGLIREVSGAASAERKYNRAVYAGTVRRGFLKGVGRERGCKAPARP